MTAPALSPARTRDETDLLRRGAILGRFALNGSRDLRADVERWAAGLFPYPAEPEPAMRERLTAVIDSPEARCGCDPCTKHAVDAIVSELLAAGWRAPEGAHTPAPPPKPTNERAQEIATGLRAEAMRVLGMGDLLLPDLTWSDDDPPVVLRFTMRAPLTDIATFAAHTFALHRWFATALTPPELQVMGLNVEPATERAGRATTGRRETGG